MVWGYWKTTEISIAPEAEYVLGFNEPNHKKQSNMTPKKAAAAWPELEKKSNGKPLVSPSAAKCGSECISNEIDWFDEFFKLCKGCRVEYLATHTYWCKANKVMRYLKTLYKRYGRKIWLTEFACSKTTSPARQLSFMKQLLPMLEDADFIYRYAWYSARLKKSGFVKTSASLLEKDSSILTALGRYYNGFQASGVSGAKKNKEKATPNIPDKHKTETPSEKETTHAKQAPSKPGGAETLLILQSFISNPTPWWKVLRNMRANVEKLPSSDREFYSSASKKQLKQRIKEKFREILCVDLKTIQAKDIRDRVEAVLKMSASTVNGKKKRRGNLQKPSC